MKTQYGFRAEHNTVDAIYVARRLQDLAQRKGERGLFLLLDWEKAFDKLSHEWLFTALRAMKIPNEIMQIIEGLYKNPTFYVEVEGIKSSTGKQETGIRQGCPLSPYLFILVMDRIFEIIPYVAKEHWDELKIALPEHQRGAVAGTLKTFRALLYADDTLLWD